jgi:UDPglucose--hexose-1-phosphate uridylyltransferase
MGRNKSRNSVITPLSGAAKANLGGLGMRSIAPSRSPEIRIDPISNDLTMYASQRAQRPNASPSLPSVPEEDFICPGCHPKETPPALLELRDATTGILKVRAVPNKYSGFSKAPSNIRYQLCNGLYGIKDPAGSCEVIFETEHHRHPIPARSTDELELLLTAIKSRYTSAKSDPSAKFWYGFKNCGRNAGGTLEHEHWQAYVFPLIPPVVQDQYDRASRYFNTTGRSLYRDIFSSEAECGDRAIAASAHFLTFAPFASRMPYEVCIAPRRDSAEFSTMTDTELADFATSLREAVSRLTTVLPNVAFNIVLRTAAFEHAAAPWFCWHLSILPRLTSFAAVEIGLNIMVNPIIPEDAATNLRAVSMAEA